MVISYPLNKLSLCSIFLIHLVINVITLKKAYSVIYKTYCDAKGTSLNINLPQQN